MSLSSVDLNLSLNLNPSHRSTHMNKHTTNLTLNETEAMHYGYEYPHTQDEPVYDASRMDDLTDLELEALYAF